MEITCRVISGEGERGTGEKAQAIRSINGSNRIERGRLRVAWEIENPKILYVQSMDMN